MKDILIAIVVAFLFICIVLQIVYIRAMFAKYDKEKYNLLNGGSSSQPVYDNNFIKAYGLSVNKADTVYVNNLVETKPELKVKIPDYVFAKCDGVIGLKSVQYSNGIWMVLNKNQGSSNLVTDISSLRTRYVIIDNKAYVVHVDRDMVDLLIASLGKYNIGERSEKEFVFIAPLNTMSYDFVDALDQRNCTRLASTKALQMFNLKNACQSTCAVETSLLGMIGAYDKDISIIILGFTTI